MVGDCRLSIDNLMKGLYVGRKRHPSKEVEAALKALVAVGWTVKEAKGRSAHAWGYVLCPVNATDSCRSGVFCRMSI